MRYFQKRVNWQQFYYYVVVYEQRWILIISVGCFLMLLSIQKQFCYRILNTNLANKYVFELIIIDCDCSQRFQYLENLQISLWGIWAIFFYIFLSEFGKMI